MRNSHHIDLRDLQQLTGETILIVGSGLTSRHLALGAIAKQALGTSIFISSRPGRENHRARYTS